MENRLHRECAKNPIRMKILKQTKSIMQENLTNTGRNGLRY